MRAEGTRFHRPFSPFPFPLSLNCLGIRQPSLGGRGRLPFGEGEMSAKPTEGYGPVGREVMDEGNLYRKTKRDNVKNLRIMN